MAMLSGVTDEPFGLRARSADIGVGLLSFGLAICPHGRCRPTAQHRSAEDDLLWFLVCARDGILDVSGSVPWMARQMGIGAYCCLGGNPELLCLVASPTGENSPHGVRSDHQMRASEFLLLLGGQS